VTKNAILLVDFTNTLRKRGLAVKDALVRAGSVRLRPILMTIVAMVMAMMPLAAGLSTGSEMRRGMSVALIGGPYILHRPYPVRGAGYIQPVGVTKGQGV